MPDREDAVMAMVRTTCGRGMETWIDEEMPKPVPVQFHVLSFEGLMPPPGPAALPRA